MAIVRKFGKPHIFLTFTANGKWDETFGSIYDGQDPNRRPDIVCRMFNAKLAELKEDILKRKVLGRVVAHSYVIEFQKRGLPHVHMVLWLHDQDAPKKPEDVDRLVKTSLVITLCSFHVASFMYFLIFPGLSQQKFQTKRLLPTFMN